GGLSFPYSNSLSGFLVMRGAGALSNRFYLDGFAIQYPYHLGDQASVLNNEFIKAVDLYTGALPARYGNATGGIIAVEGPSIDTVKKLGGRINVSLFASDIYLATPT